MTLSIFVLQFLIMFVITVVYAAVIGGFLYGVHFLITLPMRRAERARLFLDLVETAIKHGEPVESALAAISRTRDPMLGARFHYFGALLETGMRFNVALDVAPRILPAPVIAMLKAGAEIGDLGKVSPACRQHLRDSISQTQSAMNYIFILAFVVTPGNLALTTIMGIKVFPVLFSVAIGLDAGTPGGIEFLMAHRGAIFLIQLTLLIIIWAAAFFYLSGDRAARWLPGLHRLYFTLPWLRKRMQRDFAALLAVLLDAGMPEPAAVRLAADCTGNPQFQKRAERAIEQLARGSKLPEAVASMDDSGEFQWRLTNAHHAKTGFLAALTGWLEALDAKAFQQEQAASHGITTGLVILNGIFVGGVVLSVYGFLISIINAGVLW